MKPDPPPRGSRRAIAVAMASIALAATAACTAAPEEPAASAAAPTSEPTTDATAATTTTATVPDTEPIPTTQPFVAEPDVGTERWYAIAVDVTEVSEGAFKGVIGLAVERQDANVTLFPVSVGVTLFGPWRTCEVDPESWQADFSPAAHPRLDGRAWGLQLESADVIEDSDGNGKVQVEYIAVHGDATRVSHCHRGHRAGLRR